jgi:hypothetical protein
MPWVLLPRSRRAIGGFAFEFREHNLGGRRIAFGDINGAHVDFARFRKAQGREDQQGCKAVIADVVFQNSFSMLVIC